METLIRTELRSTTDPRRRLALHYEASPLGLRQKRLAGRIALSPMLDLGEYTCRAVIDWVQVSVETAHPTQFRYVQAIVERSMGRRPWVQVHGPGPGGVASVFSITLQEAHLRDVRFCLRALEEEFGSASAPVVDRMEVSIDFYPKVLSDDARAKMVAVLSRHLWPERDVISNRLQRPRFTWSRGKRGTRRTLSARPEFRLDIDQDTAPTIDATYYIGPKVARALWRVMDKVRDLQRPDLDSWLDLPEDQRRARLEVTLDQLELKGLGVVNLEGLLGFNFASLQKRYFQFMLPTFDTSHAGYADRFWEKRRQQRFLKTGVVGLQVMDEERRRLLKAARPALVRRLRAKGEPLAPAPRTGIGRNGTLVSYQDLNDRVAMALRKLLEREKRLLA